MRISLRLPVVVLVLLVAARAAANSDVGVAIDAPAFAAIGSTTTITVSLTAAGGTAQNVAVIYAIPPGMTFKSLTPIASLSCNAPASGDVGAIICQTATLGPSSPVQQAVTLNVPAGTASGQLFLHVAFVTSTSTDTNNSNDQAVATQTSAVAPNIQVTSTFPSTFVAGSPIAYTITVHNAGSAVQNVTFEERAVTSSSANYFIVAAKQTTGSGFTCSAVTPPSAAVQCSAGAFAAGASAVFTLSMETLPSVYANTIEHRATATASDFGSAFTLDQTSQGTQSSDVSVTSSAPAQVLIGADFAYTVNVRGLGPSASGSISITWTTPIGTTYRSIALTGNSQPAMICTTPAIGATGTVTCTAHDLQPAVAALQRTEVTAGFVVHVRAPSTPASVVDNVTVTAPHDPSASNNTSSATTSVISAPTADLSVSMQASKASAVVGSSVVFTTTISNAGPVTATGVTATITVPSGTIPTSLPSACTSGNTVVCTIASLASGASQGFDVAFVLDSSGTKSSSVTVTADSTDPDLSNNTAAASTEATPRTSDLAVTVVPSKTTVVIGEEFSYQVTVTASGPDTVDAVVTGVFSPSLLPRTLNSPCTASETNVTCAVTMTPGASVTYTLSFQATAATTFLTPFTVATTDSDPNPDNNAAVATVTAIPPLTSADLVVSGNVPAVVQSGAIAAYTVIVKDNGPADAANVVFTFTPPSSATIDSFTAAAPLDCQKTGTLTCTSATMTTGSSAAVVVMVRSGAASGAANIATAHVKADNDPDPSNNDLSLTTFVAGPAFSLFVDPATLAAVHGQPATFTIRLLNASSTSLSGVDLQTVLPPGMAVVSAVPSSGTCTLGPTIACHTDTVGSEDLLTIVVIAMPPLPGSYTIHVAAASGSHSAAAEVPLTIVSTSRRHAAGH